MKIDKNKLMIGDWVMIKAHQNTQTIAMAPTLCKITPEHFAHDIYEFETIPLTDSIFKQNGFVFKVVEPCYNYGIFELKTEHCFLRYSNKHKDIVIYKALRGGIDEHCNCVNRGDRYEINCGRFYIKYTYELQHILRLCNIDLDLKI